jgi:branched-chain amino acid transport system ATP-binding protein
VRAGIVHVPEGREVFPLLSVEDNLRMGAYTRHDSDAIAQDTEAVFSYFPILRERAKQEAGQLSGGQQQMLAIARALLARPALMLMDEPSLGLSPKLTKEIFDIVVRINRERGVTILLVEQNAHMALKVADFGYVLEVGRIVMEDTGARLAEKEDIREFYLGMKATGVRGTRRWKRKKLWR